MSYCENTALLIISGHVGHSIWLAYCSICVLLAFNRYVELAHPHFAEVLFSGWRTWLWLMLPIAYGCVGMTNWDLPAIYNSVYLVFFFQIDLRDGAPPVHNWVCHANSAWVMLSLVIIYGLLFIELRKHVKVVSSHADGNSTAAKQITKKQTRVQLQCFIICFFIFVVSACYALYGFIAIPMWLSRISIAALQIGCGCTSIVYLVFNESIRSRVKILVCGTVLRMLTGKGKDAKEGGQVREGKSRIHTVHTTVPPSPAIVRGVARKIDVEDVD